SANDGGVYLSSDAGATWKFAVTAGGAQFYNVAIDNSTPAWAYGSIQDVGSRRGRIDISGGRDRIPAVEWTAAPGGEGSFQAIDPDNPSIVYSHTYYGNFTREDLSVAAPARRGARAAADANAAPPATPGRPQRTTPIRPAEEDLRAQWMAPI